MIKVITPVEKKRPHRRYIKPIVYQTNPQSILLLIISFYFFSFYVLIKQAVGPNLAIILVNNKI